jgi:ABC-type transporter Mla subunit MlaD
MGIIVAMGVIALGTVTMALLGYEGPLAKPGRLVANSAVQDGERDKSHEIKTFLAPRIAPEDAAQRENQERLRAEAELEESHQKLDALLADAALIQIELNITMKLIEETVQSLANPMWRAVTEDAKRTGRAREAATRTVEDYRDQSDRYLQQFKSTYKRKWTELGRLKRQIAQQSRALGSATEIAPSTGTDVGHRLDRLEKKLDRIIESLPVK